MKPSNLAIVAIIPVVLAFTTIARPTQPYYEANGATVAPWVLERPFATLFECTTDCWDGVPSCTDPDDHYAWDAGEEFNSRSGDPHGGSTCAGSTCADRHPFAICGGNDDQPLLLEPLRAAVVAEDAEAVARFLGAFPRNAIWNDDRSAIQVLDCKGRFIAHLPLSEGTEAELKAVLN